MWTALAAAGANLAGNLFNMQSVKDANRTNVKLAREQMAFQERMSNTAVQRYAADLEKAGFNKLLAATGNSASTPSGASATVKAPEVTPLDIMAVEQARANISATRAEEGVRLATEKNLQEQNENLRLQNETLRANLPSKRVAAVKASQDERVIDSWFGRNILAPIRVAFGDSGTKIGSLK